MPIAFRITIAFIHHNQVSSQIWKILILTPFEHLQLLFLSNFSLSLSLFLCLSLSLGFHHMHAVSELFLLAPTMHFFMIHLSKVPYYSPRCTMLQVLAFSLGPQDRLRQEKFQNDHLLREKMTSQK